MNKVLTPTRHKAERKQVLADLRALRAELRTIRALRVSSRFLDREDAESRLDMAWNTHNVIRAKLRMLRACTVEKYSHVSPSAAERLSRR